MSSDPDTTSSYLFLITPFSAKRLTFLKSKRVSLTESSNMVSCLDVWSLGQRENYEKEFTKL